MAKRMLIDATHAEETRVAIVSGTKLEEFDFEIASRRQLKSNIYLAKITRVEPSLQAAFVEYGGNRHGFLPFPEIHPDYYQIPVADRERLEAAMASQAEEAEDKRERAERGDRPERGERADRERGGRSRRRRRRPRPGDAPGSEAASSDESHDDAAGETGEHLDETHEEAAQHDYEASHDYEAAHDDDAPHDDAPHEEASHDEAPHDAPAEPVEEVATSDQEHPAEDGKTDGDTPPTPRPRESLMASHLDQSITGEAPHDAETDEHDAHDEAHHEAHDDETAHDEGDHAETASSEEGESSEAATAEAPVNGEGTVEAPAEKPEELGGDDVEDLQRKRRAQMPRYKIQEVIKRRQIMLIQVSKEERGNKGAAVTTFLSLPGRYCVLMPNTPRGGGVSRKIANAGDRKKMKELLSELDVPEGMSVILRTAGLERSKTEIKRDLDYLLRLWDSIRETTLQSTAPALIYEEGRLIKRAIRDLYARDIDEVLVAGDEGYRAAKDFMRMLMPSHAKRVQPYRDEVPLLFKYGVESQIDAMHSPVAQLKSGGYIVINQTEALVSIDVNSGRSTRERGIEETALKTNCEAADEIARQLRLRDLGGLIVIDFIDMEDPKHDSQVERRLKEAMKTDRARIQIGRISAFGLLELSRQRLHPSLQETNFETCIHCRGLGVVRSTESTSLLVLRGIEEEGIKRRATEIQVRVPPQIALFLLNHKRAAVAEIEQRYGMRVLVAVDESLLIPEFRVERLRLRGPDEPAPAPIRQVYMPEPEPEPVDEVEDEDEVEVEEARPAREARGERAAERSSERETERTPERGGDEDRRGSRRRRRRRRGGRREDEAGHAVEAGDEATVAPHHEEAPSDHVTEQGDGEAHRAEPGDLSGEEGEAARRRRRGRRGGRGRSRDRVRDEQGELIEASSQDSEALLDDQPPPPIASHVDEELPFPPPAAPAILPAPVPAPRAEREVPPAAAVEQDTAPRLDDQPPPPARDYEVVNQAPETPRRGWWKRLSS
ncbi:MAG: ribonuclease [Rhodospirillales bacterium]|nr:ribonuclease [Rhodospirillales bacterium]